MRTPELCLIAAMDQNRGIGIDDRLPWHIPDDLKRFKRLTTPYSVVMGRKTLESIVKAIGKPLPNRHNIVMTRDQNFKYPGVEIAHSIEEAIDKASQYKDTRISFIGGGQIYEQAIHKVEKLFLTLVEGQFPADTFFPDYSNFRQLSQVYCESNGYRYRFVDLARQT